jgi:hypothetical protein
VKETKKITQAIRCAVEAEVPDVLPLVVRALPLQKDRPPERTRRPALKYAVCLAASLFFCLGGFLGIPSLFGQVLSSSGKIGDGNEFTMVAYAAEAPDADKMEIALSKKHTLTDDQIHDNWFASGSGLVVQTLPDGQVEIEFETTFNIDCVGTNIRYVTFTTSEGVFIREQELLNSAADVHCIHGYTMTDFDGNVIQTHYYTHVPVGQQYTVSYAQQFDDTVSYGIRFTKQFSSEEAAWEWIDGSIDAGGLGAVIRESLSGMITITAEFTDGTRDTRPLLLDASDAYR